MSQRDNSESHRSRRSADSLPQVCNDSAAPTARLVQVHPVPQSRSNILSAVLHFVKQFAEAQGKSAPALSEDAAMFLTSRAWRMNDLAGRVARAVAANEGSLITAADLRDF